jgi:hypothetical protein
MKVYVASPVRPVIDYIKNTFRHGHFSGVWGAEYAMRYVRSIAIKGCETIKELGHIPLSPILAFDGVYSEYEERERIDQACEELLLSCDAIYVVQTDYNKDSKGIARELEIAKAHNIPIIGA